MPSSQSESTGVSRTRRALLGLGGIGIATGVAGYLGWKDSDETSSSGTQAAARDSASSPTPIEGSQTSEAPPETTPSVSTKFLPHLKTNFTVQSESGSHACKLVEVSPEKHQVTPKATWATFSLFFEAPAGFLAEGGICRVSHPQMEEMELFLSPVGRTKDKALLQAAFTQSI